MLHISSRTRTGSSATRPAPIIVALPPEVAPDLAVVGAGTVGVPRAILWTDSLRHLVGELQVSQDALDPDADGGAWVVPL